MRIYERGTVGRNLSTVAAEKEQTDSDAVVDRRTPDTRPSSWKKSSTPTTT
ncbi:hypothetical protein QTP88_012930 [Uroleucon formosanum]